MAEAAVVPSWVHLILIKRTERQQGKKGAVVQWRTRLTPLPMILFALTTCTARLKRKVKLTLLGTSNVNNLFWKMWVVLTTSCLFLQSADSVSIATEYSVKFDDSMTEDDIEERSFRSLLPSEAHRRESLDRKPSPRPESDEDHSHDQSSPRASSKVTSC